MQNQELYNLVKHSKFSQVAKPIKGGLRSSSPVPTHQIIYTPKSSAIRSNFGIKTTLPKQIGFSHIVFNDIDNYKNMPDVEKYSGKMYNRMKFQEMGLVLKNYFNDHNPLFPSEATKTELETSSDSILAEFNLSDSAGVSEVKLLLKENPGLYKRFHAWLIKNNPQCFVTSMPAKRLLSLLKQYLSSDKTIKKREVGLEDFITRNDSSRGTPKIQGTGGFSYAQKGRLRNTPNGIKYGVVAPGRLVGDREAAIGGFVASVNDRTTLLQNNYSKNYPNKNSRQFTMPFKINEAEITDKGKIKLYADGIKTGSWMQRTNTSIESFDRTNYEASNPNFGSAAERNTKDNANLENLLNLINTSN
ncbi:uncharacterized protein PRCAT00004086001 [Priceomyces carsonii]|uniref:uncharacterized protein n=1 Tax=Priceomyces carsonii TaxID=28549 RepID=UPI002ED81DED|nr:unnamed protein product [Priceomyces carsonii]